MPYPINRRDLIKIGAGAALAAPAAFAVTGEPKFFTPAEFALLDELTEIIIPADDHSPGARAANVTAYIDARTAEAFEAKERDDWRAGLKLV
ncbi:MAG TPA: gluconate 2-dehydrogenase subunit 3 family protein, partial [Bryobacteraceae bacterium]|nr:gluconate 2-dehydrogenase subunit 3 family protein [Bryobacteraceae bacterium]